MSSQDVKPFSLRRWSQRKLAATRVATTDAAAAPAAPVALPATAVPTPAPEPAASSNAVPAPAPEPSLPPVESLTFESDFTAFLAPKVDEAVKRAALKKLLRDPRFNVMDGLDVYIDDYSVPSPLDADVAKGLVQARYLFDPPRTRVTAEGCVEDVPDSEAEAEAAADANTNPEPDAASAPPLALTESQPTGLAPGESPERAPAPLSAGRDDTAGHDA